MRRRIGAAGGHRVDRLAEAIALGSSREGCPRAGHRGGQRGRLYSAKPGFPPGCERSKRASISSAACMPAWRHSWPGQVAARTLGRKLIDVRVPPPGQNSGRQWPQAQRETAADGRNRLRAGQEIYRAGRRARPCGIAGVEADFRATGPDRHHDRRGRHSDRCGGRRFRSPAQPRCLARMRADDHWDVIEGQGSLVSSRLRGRLARTLARQPAGRVRRLPRTGPDHGSRRPEDMRFPRSKKSIDLTLTLGRTDQPGNPLRRRIASTPADLYDADADCADQLPKVSPAWPPRRRPHSRRAGVRRGCSTLASADSDGASEARRNCSNACCCPALASRRSSSAAAMRPGASSPNSSCRAGRGAGLLAMLFATVLFSFCLRVDLPVRPAPADATTTAVSSSRLLGPGWLAVRRRPTSSSSS